MNEPEKLPPPGKETKCQCGAIAIKQSPDRCWSCGSAYNKPPMESGITMESAIEIIRKIQKDLPYYKRLELWDKIQAGYCVHCGWEHPKGHDCQCWNEE